MKLSTAQLRVLGYACMQEAITTRRLGTDSISPNTCKSLVDLGLLTDTKYRNRFRITKAGRIEYERQRLPARRREYNLQTAWDEWVAKVQPRQQEDE
jgi:hypothetical protein